MRWWMTTSRPRIQEANAGIVWIFGGMNRGGGGAAWVCRCGQQRMMMLMMIPVRIDTFESSDGEETERQNEG